MPTILSKTNYIIYRDCPKNAWVKVNKPKIYKASEPSDFDKNLMEAGNEVDELARNLFPGGTLVKHNIRKTKELVAKRTPVIYQPKFETKHLTATPDILVWNKKAKTYDLYEVKSSSSSEGKNKKQKEDVYIHDVAFQANVLDFLSVPLGHLFLIRLNSDYTRNGELDIHDLFNVDDFTSQVQAMQKEVAIEAEQAYEYINEPETKGHCSCITRGRSNHCTTFAYSNPDVPEYSVHDISRIGSSKKKLAQLIEAGILAPEDVPGDMEFSKNQQNQITAAKTGRDFVVKEEIAKFLQDIVYPVAFIDYETFPAAVPRFSGYNPYHHIPFQFSVHVLSEDKRKPSHQEFIYTKTDAPDDQFLKALREAIPNTGSIIVWNKSFEMGRNKELAKRRPKYAAFIEDVNERVVDLRDVFTDQLYISKSFLGKTSIKYILPALIHDLSYKELDIQEGGSASDAWNKVVQGELTKNEATKRIKELLRYCKMDTFAMVNIFEVLKEL